MDLLKKQQIWLYPGQRKWKLECEKTFKHSECNSQLVTPKKIFEWWSCTSKTDKGVTYLVEYYMSLHGEGVYRAYERTNL